MTMQIFGGEMNSTILGFQLIFWVTCKQGLGTKKWGGRNQHNISELWGEEEQEALSREGPPLQKQH